MAGVNFVLGPNESYFFNCPRLWARHNLPPEIEMLFTKQPPIQDVFEMALGENRAYFVSYRDADGGVYCPLGSSNSFFAADKSACQWSSLPLALEKALQSRLTETGTWKLGEQPAFVSLGAGGSYFMRTVGGGGAWELKGRAEGINTYLTNAPNFADIKGLYLFPSTPEAYVLLTLAGTAFSNLPPHTWTDYNRISSAFPRSQPPLTSQTSQIGIQSPPPQYVQPVATAPQLQTQTQSPLSPPPQYVQPATQPLQSPQIQQPQSPQAYIPPPQPPVQQEAHIAPQPQPQPQPQLI
ncbi:uncharacterized protein K441DRAFT_557693 [Cenococcum geophilum 1.58]|uniref:uncharacterized protein n=1 Tax=Cenococcum geophilum 1.58 TaxID=794803 RepID=UPI00358F98E2|nr:hypothetical protein K441DRAFT_557693 [Cenococcum geophilum 1.58]